jgi:hypothetical protein
MHWGEATALGNEEGKVSRSEEGKALGSEEGLCYEKKKNVERVFTGLDRNFDLSARKTGI